MIVTIRRIRGGMSYRCSEGDHPLCSGVVASGGWTEGIALTLCGCLRCDCAERADLAGAAATVKARAEARG